LGGEITRKPDLDHSGNIIGKVENASKHKLL